MQGWEYCRSGRRRDGHRTVAGITLARDQHCFSVENHVVGYRVWVRFSTGVVEGCSNDSVRGQGPRDGVPNRRVVRRHVRGAHFRVHCDMQIRLDVRQEGHEIKQNELRRQLDRAVGRRRIACQQDARLARRDRIHNSSGVDIIIRERGQQVFSVVHGIHSERVQRNDSIGCVFNNLRGSEKEGRGRSQAFLEM